MKTFFSRILYNLVLLPLSLLPLFILYGISWFIRFMVFDVLKYRRGVVRNNLKNSFPDKSFIELEKIRKEFESHFGDLIVESVKNFSISERQARKRLVVTNPELLQRLADDGRSIAICGGHQNNWELYGVSSPLHIPVPAMAIYKRLSNPYFDKKMKGSRGKYGLNLVPTVESSQWIKDHEDGQMAVIFGIDQSPANPKKAYWMNWLNQETAFYFGAEHLSRKHNMAVVTGKLEKVKRGHYQITYSLITEDSNSEAYGAIIQAVATKLRSDIEEAPQYWLWTHKRWKHGRPEDMPLNEPVELNPISA